MLDFNLQLLYLPEAAVLAGTDPEVVCCSRPSPFVLPASTVTSQRSPAPHLLIFNGFILADAWQLGKLGHFRTGGTGGYWDSSCFGTAQRTRLILSFHRPLR